ncbi:C-GCAxxG-C-C family protein [Desulfurivibrio alkaliphilus]|uniref:C_GCAxxG_C_C family protein n=1 Tax=Desulfurivibrio alkaliphilus (strain DSM 19089 / UNIQEM U267 / AHT2) TaxID=589865 RepID=D6Z1G6_DESAT|nr:C-GCAxxG-C-C family protein [Desulfurivibrio alkaliphilus]ADH85421.1 C_GCAxxG_C_C family protein [Desulfurivibrio alkaliphilus AHT 2]
MEKIPELCGQRAENIYSHRNFCCAESVLVTLNGAFKIGLAENTAAALGSGFCHGMGGAGCVCGALAGGEMVLGLLLGPRQEGGLAKKVFQKEIAAVMHDRFKERFGATCCRVLLKKRKEKQGASCAELTRGATELAAELLLTSRPELATKVDHDFLAVRDDKK